MKRWLAMCLTVLSILALAGCGSKSDSDKAEKARIETENIRIIVGELASGEDSPGIKITIENIGDYDTTVKPLNVSVNGERVSTDFSRDVRAGERLTDVLHFSKAELEEKGIREIKEVSLSFSATKPDTAFKEFAGAKRNDEFKILEPYEGAYNGRLHANVILQIHREYTDESPVGTSTNIKYDGNIYSITKEGTDLYSITDTTQKKVIGMAYKDIISPCTESTTFSYEFMANCLKACAKHEASFLADRKSFTIADDGTVLHGDEEIAFVSRYQINAFSEDIFLSRAFKKEAIAAIQKAEEDESATTFTVIDDDGNTSEYTLEYKPAISEWIIRRGMVTTKYAFNTRLITITY